MAVLTAALNTEFTPAAGDFIVSTTSLVDLQRKNNGSATFATVQTLQAGAYNVSNPVAGAVYRFTLPTTGSATPVVSADQ